MKNYYSIRKSKSVVMIEKGITCFFLKRKSMAKFVLVLLVMSLAGCASGFNRDAIENEAKKNLQITLPNLKEISNLRPQINFPVKLGVVFNQSYEEWTEEEKKPLMDCAENLKREGILTDFLFIPNMLLNRENNGNLTMESIRIAAKRCGVDVVLVLAPSSGLDSYMNPAGILYLTIIGMFIIPGSHKDSLTILEGVLFDVDNEYVYLGVQSEGKGSTVAPQVFVNQKNAIKKSEKQAMETFSAEFYKQMQKLKRDCEKRI